MGMTKAKKMELSKELEARFGGPDTSEIIHEFPDGWTIRRCLSYGDLCREGEIMSHCWANSFWQRAKEENTYPGGPMNYGNGGYKDHVTASGGLRKPNTDYGRRLGDRRYCSLRDPDNIPRASFFCEGGTTNVINLSYSHNSDGRGDENGLRDMMKAFLESGNGQGWV